MGYYSHLQTASHDNFSLQVATANYELKFYYQRLSQEVKRKKRYGSVRNLLFSGRKLAAAY